MITAIVLIKTAQGRASQVAEALLEPDGIAEANSVAGPHDLVAIARFARQEDFEDLVAGRLQKTAGIEATNTLIAFRAYSRKSLEALWDVGNEERVK